MLEKLDETESNEDDETEFLIRNQINIKNAKNNKDITYDNNNKNKKTKSFRIRIYLLFGVIILLIIVSIYLLDNYMYRIDIVIDTMSNIYYEYTISVDDQLSSWYNISNNNQLIPHQIFFTYKYDITNISKDILNKNQYIKSLRNNIELIKSIHRDYGYKFYFFDDEMCYNYILQNYSFKLAEIFRNEVHGAYKADIFRIVVLYNEGGYYVDIDLKPTKMIPFHFLIDNITTFTTIQSYFNKIIFQSFIGSVPKHKILEINLKLFENNYKINSKTHKKYYINYYNHRREPLITFGCSLLTYSVDIYLKQYIGLNTSVSNMMLESYKNYEYFLKNQINIQLFIECQYHNHYMFEEGIKHVSWCPKPINNVKRTKYLTSHNGLLKYVVVNPFKYKNPFKNGILKDEDIIFYSRIIDAKKYNRKCRGFLKQQLEGNTTIQC